MNQSPNDSMTDINGCAIVSGPEFNNIRYRIKVFMWVTDNLDRNEWEWVWENDELNAIPDNYRVTKARGICFKDPLTAMHFRLTFDPDLTITDEQFN